jgi:hypothetical protein
MGRTDAETQRPWNHESARIDTNAEVQACASLPEAPTRRRLLPLFCSLRLCVSAALLLFLFGCQTKPSSAEADAAPAQKPLEQAPISNTDACAGRLHDISGVFLMYLLEHNNLPETLEALQPYARRMGVEAFACPVSGRPYVYTREGILLPEQNARVILYDPQPSHAGFRWTIEIGAPSPDQPPRTKVTAKPESFFMLR